MPLTLLRRTLPALILCLAPRLADAQELPKPEALVAMAGTPVGPEMVAPAALIETTAGNQADFILRTVVLYSRPSSCSLFILDGRDNTPLVLAADGKVAVYDLLQERILLCGNASVRFHVGMDGESLTWQSGVDTLRRDGKPFIEHQVRVDAGDILKRFTHFKVSRDTKQLVLLEGQHPRGGPSLRAMFDPAAPVPLRSLELQGRGPAEPTFCIRRIQAMEGLRKESLAFPEANLRKPETPLRVIESTDVRAALMRLMQVCLLRQAAADPDFRKRNNRGLDLAGLNFPDSEMERLAKLDGASAAMLRKLLPAEVR